MFIILSSILRQSCRKGTKKNLYMQIKMKKKFGLSDKTSVRPRQNLDKLSVWVQLTKTEKG